MEQEIQEQFVLWKLVLVVSELEQKMLVAGATGIIFHNLKLLYLPTIK